MFSFLSHIIDGVLWEFLLPSSTLTSKVVILLIRNLRIGSRGEKPMIVSINIYVKYIGGKTLTSLASFPNLVGKTPPVAINHKILFFHRLLSRKLHPKLIPKTKYLYFRFVTFGGCTI